MADSKKPVWISEEDRVLSRSLLAADFAKSVGLPLPTFHAFLQGMVEHGMADQFLLLTCPMGNTILGRFSTSTTVPDEVNCPLCGTHTIIETILSVQFVIKRPPED